MFARSNLKKALRAVDDVRYILVCVKRNTDKTNEIGTAINVLEDIESYIKKALLQLPQD